MTHPIDHWKTTPQDTTLEELTCEEVMDMDDAKVMEECKARGMTIDFFYEALRAALAEDMIEERKSARH